MCPHNEARCTGMGDALAPEEGHKTEAHSFNLDLSPGSWTEFHFFLFNFNANGSKFF